MKTKILDAGLKLYPNVTVTKIAKALNTSRSRVFYHFRASEIKDAVEEYAIEVDDKYVIAQMVAARTELVKDMSDKEKLRYLIDSV